MVRDLYYEASKDGLTSSVGTQESEETPIRRSLTLKTCQLTSFKTSFTPHVRTDCSVSREGRRRSDSRSCSRQMFYIFGRTQRGPGKAKAGKRVAWWPFSSASSMSSYAGYGMSAGYQRKACG